MLGRAALEGVVEGDLRVRIGVGGFLSDAALVIEEFAGQEGDVVAPMALDGDFGPAGEVLAEVVDGDAGLRVGSGFGNVSFEGFYRRDGFGDEFSAGAADGDCGLPRAGAEVGCVPAGLLKAGVVIFSAVGRGKGDGAGSGGPGIVGGDRLLGAVCELDVELED